MDSLTIKDGLKAVIILPDIKREKTRAEIMGTLKFLGYLFNFILLLSRIGLVVISEDIPVDRLQIRNETTSYTKTTQKTSFIKGGANQVEESHVQKRLTGLIFTNVTPRASNIHLDVRDKRVNSELISQKVQAGRIRRAPKHLYFDDEEIERLAHVALEQCPYNAFCHGNRTQRREFRAGYGPCCEDCYCDEQCGDRMDCCWDFLDNMKIKEKNNMTCITSAILPDNEQESLINEHGYLMIDSCHGDPTNECSKKTASAMGPFYPTYAQATSVIYYNRFCASCNGVRDSIPFNMYVYCIDEKSLDGLSFIGALNRKQCRVWFRPPQKSNVDKYVCYEEPRRTCSLTDGQLRNDINLEKACQLTTAYFSGKNPDNRGSVKYANVFCRLCDGRAYDPNRVCSKTIGIFRSTNKLTTLVDYKVLSDSWTSDAQGTIGTSVVKQKHTPCRDNTVKHPTKEVCRQLLCPNGAIRTPRGCKLFAKIWYVSGYQIHVTMTPTSERLIPLPEFNEHTQNEQDIDDWLDTNGLKVNHILMWAEETEVNNVTFLKRMNVKLGSSMYPLNASKLLKAIDKSLSRQWKITLNESVYTYVVRFDKYITFVQTGDGTRKKWIGTDTRLLTDRSHEPFVLPKVYTLILAQTKLIGFEIYKLYFCEKIELYEDEWTGGFSGLWLNLTGSGNDTFLGDGEYLFEQNGTKDIRIQICADDFLSQFASKVNSAQLFLYTPYLVYYLTFSSISILV